MIETSITLMLLLIQNIFKRTLINYLRFPCLHHQDKLAHNSSDGKYILGLYLIPAIISYEETTP